MRPMGLGKKPPAYDDPAREWLGSLSKAALIDCVIDLLRANGESADDPVSVDAAFGRLLPVLTMRGDKAPKAAECRQKETP